MTDRELFRKNNILASAFSLYVLQHPEVAEFIPDEAQVVLLPQDDPQLCEKNSEIAQKAQEIDDVPNRPLVYVWVEKVIPAQLPQLVNPRLELVKQ